MILRGVIGEPDLIAAIHLHHIDFKVTVSFRREGEMSTIWRPRRVVFMSRIFGQSCLLTPVNIHHIDFEIAISVGGESNLRHRLRLLAGLPTLPAPESPGRVGPQEFHLGTEGGEFVFVGNDESAPFAINMPIAAGDGDLVTFGLWPYGVHGGGHPEGHPGIDIEYAPGAPVRAAAAGTVTYIGNNTHFPTQWDLLLEVRPGVVAQYDHMGTVDPSISVGVAVTEGQVLGGASSPLPHTVIHFGLRHGVETLCPTDYLNAAGQATFDAMWVTARYAEELVEPLANNPVDVTFPLTSSRTRVSGTLPERIEFTRLDATTYDTTYILFDATDTAIESGTASFDPFNAIGELDLIPTSPAGPTRLAVLDIQGEDLWIDWDTTTRPTSLAGASHYRVDSPGR